jgi:DNA-directed RNA polymerase alpha subunit
MKSKGGRAKKANYSTVVMRIPAPLKVEVQRLMGEFYSTVNIEKPVTSIELAKDDKPVTGIELVKDKKPVTGIEQVKDEKPTTGIEILELPTRISNLLTQYGFDTIERLLAVPTVDNISYIEGLGKQSLKTIKDALKKYR